MKKNWIYLFLSMAITVMPLTSCSNDDDEPKPNENEEESQHDATSDADQVAYGAFDALDWLQGSLVMVDENGEMIRRVYGKPLDFSDTTVIYIPVEDLADAEGTFLGWVAPGKGTTQTGGGYDYTLTDPEGNNQGAVSFIAEDGENGEIARMTVAPGTNLKQVSEVKFINAEAWPENDATPEYIAGNTYRIYDERYLWVEYPREVNGKWEDFRIDKETHEFYCIQGNNNGDDAVLVWLSPDCQNEYKNIPISRTHILYHPKPAKYLAQKLEHRLPTVSQLMRVLDIHNSNPEAWQKMLKVMDEKGYQWSADDRWFNGSATGTAEFLFGGTYGDYITCLDLDDEEELGLGLLTYVKKESLNQYRYMHIRIYPPATK